MKPRIAYFDIAKGILILMVVIGHVFESGFINQFVYSFHMPAFFIISGIMQHYSSSLNKPIGKALLGKVYTLIIPFLFFEVLGAFSNILRFGITLNIFGYASNTLKLWCNNGPDWFIWALFVDEVLFLIIHKAIKNKYIIWAVTGCIGLFMIINHNFYSTFGSTGIGFLFLTFGYYSAPVFMKKRSMAGACIALIISLITCVLNGKVDLGPWVFGSIPLYIVSALAGTYWVIEGSKFITSRLLTYYGRNTLTVLGTHQAINLPLREFAGITEYSTMEGICVFIILAVIELPIIFLFNKFIPFLIGKNKRCCNCKLEPMSGANEV